VKTIVFVHPPLSLEKRYGTLAQAGYTEPPFGLCYLAAITREKGMKTSIVDAEALNLDFPATMEAIMSTSPDYVGITVTTQLVVSAATLATEIKKRKPKIIIMVGGAHITALPRETLQDYPCFDFGVIGEGEQTLTEFLDAMETGSDLKQIDGLAIRQPGNTVIITGKRALIKDLDTLPFPAFDLLPRMGEYYRVATQSVKRLPALSLITSRGCTGKCTFCDSSVHGHIPRAHSAEYVARMMTTLSKEYGAKSIFFDDDNFLIFKPRLKKLVEILKNQKLDISWSCMGRVNMVDAELLELAKSGGCWQVMYGVETANQPLLDFYQKGITPEQVENAVKVTHKVGLKAKGFIMFGNPLETKETIKNTIDFIKRIKLDDVSISFFTPFPGTAIYNEVEKYGKFEKDWAKMSCFDIVFIPNGLNEAELRKAAKNAYRQFYFRPRILLSYLSRLNSWAQLKALLASGLTLLRYMLPDKKRSSEDG
jgi:anaerobic magnesium-protoporphyrin IX monomethyl ester cyclase